MTAKLDTPMCEAVTYNGEAFRRCVKHSSTERNGHRVCGMHARLAALTFDLPRHAGGFPMPEAVRDPASPLGIRERVAAILERQSPETLDELERLLSR